MQKILANKGFSRPTRVRAWLARARVATEMLDRKRWFLSDCQVLLHYLGVSSSIEHVRVARHSRCRGDARSRATRAQRGRHQGLSELLTRGVPEQERRDCRPGSPRPEGVVEG